MNDQTVSAILRECFSPEPHGGWNSYWVSDEDRGDSRAWRVAKVARGAGVLQITIGETERAILHDLRSTISAILKAEGIKEFEKSSTNGKKPNRKYQAFNFEHCSEGQVRGVVLRLHGAILATLARERLDSHA